jgi:predicted DNA-binding transcriptional regulator AlpA
MTLPGPAAPEDRLLSWPEVRARTSLSRTTAWRLQKAGAFPKPIRISPGRVAWRSSELTIWERAQAPSSASEHLTPLAPTIATPPPTTQKGRPVSRAAEPRRAKPHATASVHQLSLRLD